MHDIKFENEQAKAWRDLMRQHSGYRQLVDEQGEPFENYEYFCRERNPFGLGREPSEVDAIGESSITIPLGSTKEIADKLTKNLSREELQNLYDFLATHLT